MIRRFGADPQTAEIKNRDSETACSGTMFRSLFLFHGMLYQSPAENLPAYDIKKPAENKRPIEKFEKSSRTLSKADKSCGIISGVETIFTLSFIQETIS